MTGTGYSITFNDFTRLAVDDYSRADVVHMLRQWFNYEVVPDDKLVILRDAENRPVDAREVYDRIQADAEMQQSLYNTAMTHWR